MPRCLDDGVGGWIDAEEREGEKSGKSPVAQQKISWRLVRRYEGVCMSQDE